MIHRFYCIRILILCFIIVIACLETTSQVSAENELTLGQHEHHQFLRLLPASCQHWGEFQQSLTLAGISDPVKSSGYFIFDCMKGLAWFTQEPLASTLIYLSDSKAIKIDYQGQEHSIDGRIQREIGRLLNSLIGGDLKYMTRTFNITGVSDIYSLKPIKNSLRKYISYIDVNLATTVKTIVMVQPSQSIEIVITNSDVIETLSSKQCKTTFSFMQGGCERLLQ